MSFCIKIYQTVWDTRSFSLSHFMPWLRKQLNFVVGLYYKINQGRYKNLSLDPGGNHTVRTHSQVRKPSLFLWKPCCVFEISEKHLKTKTTMRVLPNKPMRVWSGGSHSPTYAHQMAEPNHSHLWWTKPTGYLLVRSGIARTKTLSTPCHWTWNVLYLKSICLPQYLQVT